MTDSAGRRQQAADLILAQPLHRACELDILSWAEGRSEIRIAVNDFSSNVIGTLHGGVIYAMVDVAAFMALLSVVPDGLHGVTADIQVSVLRALKKGEFLHLRGRVDRVGRHLANMRVEAFQPGSEEKLIATGTVVKSLIAAPY